MIDISTNHILNAWEQGSSSHPEEKTRALLSLARPSQSQESRACQVLGERNSNLLELRKELFGSALQAYIECSECGEALDVEFTIEQLGFSAYENLPENNFITINNLTAQVRLPNSYDLEALTNLDSVTAGRDLLFSRCVSDIKRANTPVTLGELSDEDLNALETAISGLDPRMEILFDLQCPECSHKWKSPLDISSFLWRELDNYAKQLLENVHVLASTYGWSEYSILEMSKKRREYYLNRLLQ